MQKNYDHNASEDNIYASWESSGAMKADNTSKKKAFTIPIPPPNVTGQLHLGHAAMLAIEDILIRYKKMTGHEALWVPGTDHAAIATENVVLKHLGMQNREEMSREDFLTECRKFAGEKSARIVDQMRKMGASLDWSREAYTFDEERNNAVNTIFKQLYDDGLIVRGHRMINWSTGAQSVIADDELEWEDRAEPFYYIKCGPFIIGTVRSETKCSDSPVLVHPTGQYLKLQNQEGDQLIISEHAWQEDETFAFLKEEYVVTEKVMGSALVGMKFEYETYAGIRKFWVLADNIIDMEKGTGAMTISASHSEDDYELATRLNLKDLFFQKITLDGKMTRIAGPCEGIEVERARKRSVEIMREKGLLIAEDKNYKHRVPLCYRSGCVIEPMVSEQWFVAVDKEFTDKWTGEKTTLKKLTQEAVRGKNGETPAVKIIPERFEKIYFQWIDNLRDWCISRQIWWGHRIPVWYGEVNGETKTVVGTPTELEKKGATNIRQDEDTLDTWFSSALWPFSTLGWPNEKADDYQKFYPTDVLETGHDILFFWVARMIMFGRYATGKYPFHTVYLHGLVCDEKGQKMSKSKGNGIDPLEVIEEVGADAVRLSLVVGTTPGNPIPLGKAKISGYRNFVNKLWNAGRFVKMQLDAAQIQNLENTNSEPKSLADKWIATRFSQVVTEIKNHLENYEIATAGDKIYHFVWDEFCAWYLEAQKVEQSPEFLAWIFFEILALVHPLCPFITEKLYKDFWGEKESLMNRLFPEETFKDKKALETFIFVQNITNQIRSIRAEKKLNPKEKIAVKISAGEHTSALQKSSEIIKVLANLSNLEIEEKIEKPEHSVVSIIDGMEIFVEIPFDEAAEKERLTKEIDQLKKQIAGLEGRLGNKGYVENAPAHLIDETKKQLEDNKAKLKKLETELKSL